MRKQMKIGPWRDLEMDCHTIFSIYIQYLYIMYRL